MPRSKVRATHVPALEPHEWNDGHFHIVENPNGRSKNGKRHVIYVTDNDPMACSYCGKMSVSPGAIVGHFKICTILNPPLVRNSGKYQLPNFVFSENASSTPSVFCAVFCCCQSASRPEKALKITKLKVAQASDDNNEDDNDHKIDDDEDDNGREGGVVRDNIAKRKMPRPVSLLLLCNF